MKSDPLLYCAIDIGTAVVKTVIAQKSSDGPQILGCGIYPSAGMKKGQVIDFKKIIQSVRLSYEQAHLQVGLRPIASYGLSLAPQSLQITSQRYAVPIKRRCVTEYDLAEIEKKSLEKPLGSERQILHTIMGSYSIDHHFVDNPLGIRGIKLEAQASHLHVASYDLRTRLDVLSELGLQVQHVVADPLATPIALLDQEQKEEGCVVIDLGAGTTKMSIYQQGALAWMKVWPIGGEHLTADLAQGLGTSRSVAEVLKIRHGGLDITQTQLIQVPLLHQRSLQTIEQGALNWVLKARLKEIFELCLTEIRTCPLAIGSAGVVLTGGGSQLSGVVELAQEVLRRPTCLGTVATDLKSPFLNSPSAVTVLGLLYWMLEHQQGGTGQIKDWPRWCQNFLSWMAS